MYADWCARLKDARARHEQELKAINYRFLPMFVLSMPKSQLERAYRSLFRRTAPAKLADIAAGILGYKQRAAIFAACVKAQKNPHCEPGAPQLRYRQRNRASFRLRGRLRRLDAEIMRRERANRQPKRARDNARTRAWWNAMEPGAKKKYMVNQWRRRKARIDSEPGGMDAYRKQKREEAAARRERIRNDPIAKALDAKKQAEKSMRRRPKRQERYRQIMADPVLAEQRREQTHRAQQRLTLRRASPAKAKALTRKIVEMVPKTFPPELKGDLCQEILASLMAGETSMKDLAGTIKKKATKVRKLLAETWKQRSLDEVVPGTERLRLIDTIRADQQHY
jgi:hypothetical protein